MIRPTTKELYNKIRDARNAVANDRIEIVEADAVAADAIELEYDLESELRGILGKSFAGLLTGCEIRQLRESKNLTQETLAQKLGVDKDLVEKWEKCNIQSQSMDKLLRSYLK
jgi:DNA-binding transcriptional regulator YiaG